MGSQPETCMWLLPRLEVGIFHVDPMFHPTSVAWNLGLMQNLPSPTCSLVAPVSLFGMMILLNFGSFLTHGGNEIVVVIVCSHKENLVLHWFSVESEVFLEWTDYSECPFLCSFHLLHLWRSVRCEIGAEMYISCHGLTSLMSSLFPCIAVYHMSEVILVGSKLAVM